LASTHAISTSIALKIKNNTTINNESTSLSATKTNHQKDKNLINHLKFAQLDRFRIISTSSCEQRDPLACLN